MPGENASVKAGRLLVEGRVVVRGVDEPRRLLLAEVRGDSGEVYRVPRRG